MTQEDKDLLLKDLCARLPYGVHLFTNSKHHIRLLTISNDIDYNEQYWVNGLYDIDEVKPYLRSISSMTEKELKYFLGIRGKHSTITDFKKYIDNKTAIVSTLASYKHHIDWLNKNMFDYRGLIPLGLAIEVTKDNNPYEEHQ